MSALTGLVNLFCKGVVPPSVSSHLCGATLLPLVKKGGGHRPIAVGEVLRRLASKCISLSVCSLIPDILSPLQVGVAVANGAEAIVHAVKSVWLNPDIPPTSKWILLVDFANAFNSVNREHMFTSIREVLPQISPWMECCYQTPSLLHLGGSHILSCSGVQQGDPLGPLGFALALHPILIKIRNRLPSLTVNSWYLDDGTLCGSPGDLRTALDIIEEEGPSCGLTLNRSKSLLIILCDDSSVDDPSFTNPLPAEIPATRGGFTLLGSPIGDPQFCNETVLQRVLKVKPVLDLLPELENAQMSLSLLRSCLSPKIAFSLRTSPASSIPEAISRFDSLLYDSLSDTVGSFLSPWSWNKATLPVSLGGVGLRRASHYASAPTLGQCQSSSIVESILGSSPSGPDLSSSLSDLSSLSGRSDWSSIQDVDCPLQQRFLSNTIYSHSFKSLLSSSPDNRSRAFLLSSSIPHAGAWLQAVPSSSLGLLFPDIEFRLSLKYWLGVPLYPEDSACLVCSTPGDIFGDHQVSCGGNGDRIHRHDALRNIISAVASAAALGSCKEVPSLIPGRSSRPVDIFLPNWQH